MTALATVALLLVIPLLELTHRAVEPTGAPRSFPAAMIVASTAAPTVVWLGVAASVPGVSGDAMWLPTGAMAALAGYLMGVPMRQGSSSAVRVLVASIAWNSLVFTPVALSVNFPVYLGLGALSPVVDLGGALPVHIAAGSSLLALVLLRRARQPRALPGAPSRDGRSLLLAVALWATWTLALVGLEQAIDEVTAVIVADSALTTVGAIAGWLLIGKMRSREVTGPGVLVATVCGLVGATPGSGILAPNWAFAIGLVAGVVPALILTRRAVNSPQLRQVWVILAPAVISLVLLGLFGDGFGFIYTGQAASAQTQLLAAVFTIIWAGLIGLVLWPLVHRGRSTGSPAAEA